MRSDKAVTAKMSHHLLLVVWLSGTLIIMAAAVWLSARAEALVFSREASQLYESLLTRLRVNDAVTEGFAAVVKNDETPGFQHARQYAQDVRTKYPHIYMFEVQHKVDFDDVAAFETAMGEFGLPDFRVKNFTYDSSREWVPVVPRPFYFPITFMEPMTDDARPVLGLDVYSVPHLHEAIDQAVARRTAVASRPFDLAEGGRAFVLFRSVDQGAFEAVSLADNFADVGIVVSSVVLMDGLLKGVTHPLDGDKISLEWDGDPQGNDGSQSVEWRDAFGTTPTMYFSRALGAPSQPLRLTFERPLTWNAVNVSLLSLILLVSMSGYAILVARLKARRDAELTRAQTMVELESRVAERTDQLRERTEENKQLTRRLISLAEQERKKLARDLHDELGQSLTAIKADAVLISNLSRDRHPEIHKSARMIHEVVSRSYDFAHQLMRRFRPTALDDIGLEAALQECIASYRFPDHGIECTCAIDQRLPVFDEDISITVYRIVQEALTNVLRHSRAARASVEVDYDAGAGQLRVSVKNNGYAVPELTNRSGGFGLLGLRERVEGLNGRFETRREGTDEFVVEATIPYSADSPARRQ